MPKNDIDFTFDTSNFETAMGNMTGSMDSFVDDISAKMQDASNKFGDLFEKQNKTSKETLKNQKDISGGVFRGMAKFAILKGLIVGFMKQVVDVIRTTIPEIGKTFEIAKNIMFKNLFWPLRKEILPLLQKILDWTRKNRKNFVRFGTVIVNAFRLVKQIIKTVLNLLKPIADKIKKLMKSIFGDTARSITDAINLGIFKLTTFVIALETLLKPIFEGLGSLLGGVIVAIKEFGKGFVEGFSVIFKPLEEGNNLIEQLGSSLSDIGDILKDLAPAFKILGKAIGIVFAGLVSTAVSALKSLLTLLKSIFKLVKSPNKFKEIGADITKAFGGRDFSPMGIITALGQKALKSQLGKSLPTKKVKDAIITKTGKVIETSPDDNIIATKSGIPGMGGGNVTVNLGDIKLIVTEGNARAAGENWISGVVTKIRPALMDSLVLSGGF